MTEQNLTKIVCLSGGKDSTAMALRLRELHPNEEYKFICTPTGDELPPMVEHWKRLECILGTSLIYLNTKTLFELIREMKMLPNWRARWCTRILKIEIAQEYYEQHLPAEVYVGLRADEPDRKGNKLFDNNVRQAFPLREWGWGINEVLKYLDRRGVKIPRRTDCGMCFYQRIGEWWELWREFPARYAEYEALENEIGHTLLSPGKFKNWPHALKDLRAEFEKGRLPRGINSQLSIF